jgi:hypothetical protein
MRSYLSVELEVEVGSRLALLRPIYQLAQLVNWPELFRQFVNPYQLINRY